MGYPSALTAKTWGFYDVLFRGKPFRFKRPYGSYVMENVLFKISFPAEFHAQTAVECAVQLHPEVGHRLDDVKKVVITTHESAIRIIDKKGPLNNPADRDHCIQYMTAIGLIKGNLTAADYEDAVAADPRIDRLRAKMACVENKRWTRDYLDPAKRSIANAVQVFFKDGTKTEQVRGRIPRRPPPPPQGGHTPAGGEVQDQSRAPVRAQAAAGHTGAVPATRSGWRRTPVNEFVDLFAT